MATGAGDDPHQRRVGVGWCRALAPISPVGERRESGLAAGVADSACADGSVVESGDTTTAGASAGAVWAAGSVSAAVGVDSAVWRDVVIVERLLGPAREAGS